MNFCAMEKKKNEIFIPIPEINCQNNDIWYAPFELPQDRLRYNCFATITQDRVRQGSPELDEGLTTTSLSKDTNRKLILKISISVQ